MVFVVQDAFNASVEIARVDAGNYSSIRLFTVG